MLSVLEWYRAAGVDVAVGEEPVDRFAQRPPARVTPPRAAVASAVAERPAAPAEVVILDAIPVTAVGKIFKPALRRDAAERALAAAVAELGVHVAGTLDE